MRVLEVASIEQLAAPKTRLALRGQWSTPAETRIALKWDDIATNHMPVVQVRSTKPKIAPLEDAVDLLVSAWNALKAK